MWLWTKIANFLILNPLSHFQITWNFGACFILPAIQWYIPACPLHNGSPPHSPPKKPTRKQGRRMQYSYDNHFVLSILQGSHNITISLRCHMILTIGAKTKAKHSWWLTSNNLNNQWPPVGVMTALMKNYFRLRLLCKVSNFASSPSFSALPFKMPRFTLNKLQQSPTHSISKSKNPQNLSRFPCMFEASLTNFFANVQRLTFWRWYKSKDIQQQQRLRIHKHSSLQR